MGEKTIVRNTQRIIEKGKKEKLTLAVEIGGELNLELLLESVDHGDLLERRGEINLEGLALGTVGVVLDLVPASDVLDESGEEALGDLHEVVVVGVGHVKLAGGELGVVGEVDTLVTELATNLVYAVNPSNNKHLEVELGGDAHEEVHVQVVVMGDEGLGGGASSDHVHHGGLHLEEAEGVEEAAEVADDLGADDELVPDGVVDDEVKVALAEAGLLVLEAIVRLGDHVQAGGEELDVLGEDGELPTLGLAGVATDADNVTTADDAVDLVKVLLGEAGIAHNLNVEALAVDVVEDQLALGTLGHEATGHSHGDRLVSLALLDPTELLNESGDGGVNVELVRVGGLALLLQRLDGPGADLEVLVGVEVLLIITTSRGLSGSLGSLLAGARRLSLLGGNGLLDSGGGDPVGGKGPGDLDSGVQVVERVRGAGGTLLRGSGSGLVLLGGSGFLGLLGRLVLLGLLGTKVEEMK